MFGIANRKLMMKAFKWWSKIVALGLRPNPLTLKPPKKLP